VIVTGDWGDGSADAQAVADAIEKRKPECTIHLGDIYRVGSVAEVRSNFLGEGVPEDEADGEGDGSAVRWPRGVDGDALAVPGNHEYQSGGRAFHQVVLPTLGVAGEAETQLQPQRTSYFCLQNDHWRIIGLDTGYHSVHMLGLELFVLILNRFWLIKGWSWVQGMKTKLSGELIDWLQGVLSDDLDDPRAIIFLSHHQYISALDGRGDYPKPGRQIAELLQSKRQVLWIYGHEHRLAVYESQERAGAEKLTVYGRAVGIGSEADTIDLSEKRKRTKLQERARDKKLEYADNRSRRDDPEAGHPGWAELSFHDSSLHIEYHTVDPERGTKEIVLKESFEAHAGDVIRKQVDFALDHPDFLGPEWREPD
jgi:predicted phosphodiesterase